MESVPLRRKKPPIDDTAVSQAGAQIRRLLTGYLLLGIVSMAVATSGLVLQVVELPGLAYHNLITLAPTNPQVAARGQVTAHQKRSASATGVDDAALDRLNGILGHGAGTYNAPATTVDADYKDLHSKDGELRALGPNQKEIGQRYVLAGHGVNIRKSPNGEIVRRAETAERLEFLGRERTWNRVRLPDGTEAFIHESVVIDSDAR